MLGRGVRTCRFLLTYLSLYDYQSKASRYRKRLAYLKKGNHKSKTHNRFTKTKKKRTQENTSIE